MFCIILPFCSAAKSSCKFAIGSPFAAIYAAVNGVPAADCGYTSTPCGVCLLSILKRNFLGNYSFCIFHILYLEIWELLKFSKVNFTTFSTTL